MQAPVSVRHLSAVLLAGTSLLSSAVTAQQGDDDASFTLEEIVVTAQKRAESLQDVPISVSAITGTKIQEAGIQDFGELANLVPNFQVNEDPIGDKVNIRGIQSGNNAGIEQSIGTYVDGVYRGRGVQSRFAFLDVERVEVLRGPQGTLFGKNTIGGALNITTARPTEEFSAGVDVGYNFDFHEWETQGHVSGALSDKVRARAAWLYRDMSKGWVENTSYGEGAPQREEWAGRLTLEWDATENTLVTARYEHGDFNVKAQPFSTLTAGPLAAFGVQSGLHDKASIGNNGFGPFPAFYDFGSAGAHTGDSDEMSLTVQHDLANGSTLTVSAANSVYDFVRKLDADFSPIPGIRFDDTEDFKQKSLEVRLVSEQGNTIDYILGAYYQDYNLKADGDGFFNVPFFNAILKQGCAGAGIDPLAFAGNLGRLMAGDLSAAPALFGQSAAAGSAAALRTCLLSAASTNPATGGARAGFNRYHMLDMDSETFAAFAQATWNVSDALRVTGGLRFSQEKKEADQLAYGAFLGERTPSTDPNVIYLLKALGEAVPHTFTTDDLNRKENSLTWSLNAQYDATEDMMLYATASTGYKAGGFNSFALSADPDEAEFDDEKVLAFEVGSKMSLADGRAELNLAAFHTTFDNLQTALFTGSTSFIVQNAAKAKVKGIEADMRWQLTPSLMLTGGAGYLDFKYDSFPNAGCTVQQLLAFREETYQTARGANNLPGMLGAAQLTLQNCSAAGINDLAGRPSDQAPEFNFTLGATHHAEVGAYEVSTSVDYIWQDKQYRQADLDPTTLDNAFGKLNASVTFGPTEGVWALTLLAKNITDTKMFVYANDTPLFDGARQFIAGQPRSIELRGSLKF